jgi:pimeloyl-ACP methyl ester carboxylesterase
VVGVNDSVTERVELAVAEEGGTSAMAAHLARPAAQGPFPGIAPRRGRVLYLVGDGDRAVPPDARARIESALRLADVRHEMVVYPDTPHGFFCDVRDTYREPQARTLGVVSAAS